MREDNQRVGALPKCGSSTFDCARCGQFAAETAAVVEKHERFVRGLFDRQDEIERSIVSSIHDDLAQHLTAALLHLEGAQPLQVGTANGGQEHVRAALKLLRGGIGVARRMAARLQPLLEHTDSVELGIEGMLHEMRSRGGPEIECQIQGEMDPLPPELGNTLLRILHELLANACCHSRSDEVRLQVVRSQDCLRLEVEDQGIGFDPEEVGGKKVGLQVVQQRAKLLGGKVVVESAPGKGTRVVVSLPLADPRPRVAAEVRETALVLGP